MQLFAFNAISVRDIFECDSEQPSARSRDVGREPALRTHLLARDNNIISRSPSNTHQCCGRPRLYGGGTIIDRATYPSLLPLDLFHTALDSSSSFY